MARSIARSSAAYMQAGLKALSLSADTPFATVRDAVARDESETEPVRRVLAVMTKQKFITINGEGDAATYRLTESGADLLKVMVAR